LKASTHLQLNRVKAELLAFFGSGKPLGSVTSGDADLFAVFLAKDRRLAPNTARRTIGRAKQIFEAAIRHRLIGENPFKHLVSAVQSNPARFHFITPEDARKVIDACPDARWGGLRTPSETMGLKWEHVREHGRIVIPSPKTERHAHGAFRVIPLFPELRPYLEDALEVARDEWVIPRNQKMGEQGWSKANLRTTLQKIIIRAGLKPWPKLFQNLRSTRETELAETCPEHVVCQWNGNSQLVARQHYLQLTDEHFQRASGKAEIGTRKAIQPKSAADSGARLSRTYGEALQNAVQHGAAEKGTSGKEPSKTQEKAAISAVPCLVLPLDAEMEICPARTRT
jgi:integrase